VLTRLSQDAGWQDGPSWAAKRLKELQPNGSERQQGGQVAEKRRTQLAFFGDSVDSKSGLVTDGLLKSGGLEVFGVKADWRFDSSAGWTESVAPHPESWSLTDAAEAEAVKHFVWLHRVGNDYNLMKRYTTYFNTTDGLLKFLRGLRVRCVCLVQRLGTHLRPHRCSRLTLSRYTRRT
jgi:hypothetical protein